MSEEVNEKEKEIEAISWKLSKTEKVFLGIQAVLVILFVTWMYTGVHFEGRWVLGIPNNIFGSWMFGIASCVITVIFGIKLFKEIQERMKKEG